MLLALVLVLVTSPDHAAEPPHRYVEAGVPAADRTWSGADYNRC